MSDFPGAIDTFRSPDNIPGNSYDPAKTTTIFSEDFSTRSDAIIAIEETLGVNPQGTQDTVDERVGLIESSAELLDNKSGSTSLGTSDTLYPTQNAVKTYVDAAITAAKSAMMPVGTIYTNYSSSTNPGTLLGFGTWVSITDRVIIGAGSLVAAAATDGASTHSHPLSAAGQAQISTTGSGFFTRRVTAGYTATRQASLSGDASSSAVQTVSAGLQGATDSASSLPPVVGAYIWRRTV